MTDLFEELGNLIRERDVEGLGRAFSLAGDWDSRETVMVAFRNFSRDAKDDSQVRDRMRSVLPDLLGLCKAESSGGSYRDNCIEMAQSMLADLDQP